MKWKQRGFKLLSSFVTGYSGGFIAVLPTNYLLSPHDLELSLIFSIPLLTGLIFFLPNLGKMFGEMANEA